MDRLTFLDCNDVTKQEKEMAKRRGQFMITRQPKPAAQVRSVAVKCPLLSRLMQRISFPCFLCSQLQMRRKRKQSSRAMSKRKAAPFWR